MYSYFSEGAGIDKRNAEMLSECEKMVIRQLSKVLCEWLT